MLNIRLCAPRNLARLAATTALTIIVAACGGGGGGGGGGVVSTPPPPPPPPPAPPPPPPPPPNYVKVFPGITTTTQFAALGLQADTIPASSLITSGFAVRYDAALDAYVFDIPAGSGKFRANSEDSSFWYGWLEGGGSSWPGYEARVFKPSATNSQLVLRHTSFVSFFDYDYDDYAPAGFIAFGTATPSSGVPTTGSATFDAIVAGLTLDRGFSVGGTASLQFNFGAGTLAGSFAPFTYNSTGLQVGLGTYNFVNTVFGVGSTTFSGQLQHGGTPNLGAFNGMFTGPAAQELMAKWTAPYQNPDTSQWSEMFGIWVGKKCC